MNAAPTLTFEPLDQPVTLTLSDGCREVTGYAAPELPGLAVTWSGHAWAITHLRSGRAVASFDTRMRAQAAASQLQGPDWTGQAADVLTSAHDAASRRAGAMPGLVVCEVADG